MNMRVRCDVVYVQDNVSRVRSDIARFIGSKVKMESNKGRSKAVITEGVLENTYPSIFTIRLDLESEEVKNRTVSFSYTEILTRAVEMTVFE